MDLLLPRRCAGCRAAGTVLCPDCREAFRRPPERVTTVVDTHVPVFALGPYDERRASAVIAMKERGNLAVRGVLGAVLRAGVETLRARGELPEALTLVPAPTRPRSARLRGGDHVTDLSRATGLPVAAVLRHGKVADSVGLSSRERRRNLAGGVELARAPAGPVLLVDDVVTTGATLAASTEVLVSARRQVVAALTFAAA